VDKAQTLKQDAVVTRNVDWQHPRTGFTGQGGDMRAPGRVGDFPLARMEMGYRPPREGDQCAPITQPRKHLSEGRPVAQHGLPGFGKIDRDYRFAEIRNVMKELVPHYLYITPYTGKKMGENYPFHPAIRMVGNNNQGAVDGNFNIIVSANRIFDVQGLQSRLTV
jgi:hypothetical protein